MTAAATVPTMDAEQADRIRRISERRAKLDDQWRAEIIAAVAAGASLREVAEVAGISHTAVKFIAHGRPPRVHRTRQTAPHHLTDHPSHIPT